MKNITLSGDETLIQKAREKARQENTNLNTVFREWLARYVGQDGGAQRIPVTNETALLCEVGATFQP